MDSKLSVTANSYFTITAATSSASISCGQQILPPDNFWLSFSGIQLVNISGITLVNCTMGLYSVANVSLVQSSFVNMTAQSLTFIIKLISYCNLSSLLIMQCTFANNTAGISGSNSGNLTIVQSTFINNHPRVQTLSHDGGELTMIFDSSNGGTKTSYTYSTVVMVIGRTQGVIINNTNFTNNIAGDTYGTV